MNQWVQSLVYPILNKRKYLPEGELNRYVLMQAVALVATSVHLLFAVFFLLVGSVPLAISHSVGILVFVASVVLLRRRKYDLSGVMLGLMIIFSTLATIHTIGGNNYSILYQYFVLLMMVTVPFSNKKIPVFFGIFSPILMVASFWYDKHHTPLQSIGAANDLLGMANIVVCALGTITMLFLERLVRNFVGTYQRQKMENLRDQIYLDPLTQLYNRRYADDYFEGLQGIPPSFGICAAIADIDDFKVVNDTYGHDTGDVALRDISTILQNNTRKSDLVFRWGGEEFLIILQDTSLENAWQTLEKIRLLVSEHTIRHNGVSFRVSITMGLAQLDPQQVQNSLALCDKKLYLGKNSGKNRVVL